MRRPTHRAGPLAGRHQALTEPVAPFAIQPPTPASPTAHRTRAVLIWFGWVIVYVLGCGATFLLLDGALGGTTWWAIPDLIVRVAAALAIGLVYPYKAWCLGPLVAGLVLPL